MPYFRHKGKLGTGENSALTGPEAQHARQSRRLRPGERIEVQDSTGARFQAVVESVERRAVNFRVESELPVPPPSPLTLNLLVALPKEKALDFVLQKSTELGVSQLTLFPGAFSPKPSGSTKERLQRWQRIAEEACKQSGRQFPPQLHWRERLEDAVEETDAPAQRWVLTPEGQPSWLAPSEGLATQAHQVLIGPEGGLHPDEVAWARSRNFRELALGPRILRTETAVLSVAAILQFLHGDLGSTGMAGNSPETR